MILDALEALRKVKSLAALAHPKDKITHKDVLVGRGVLKKEEVESVAEGSKERDPVWNKGTPMPKDYTCHCGLYVHPDRRNPKAIHASDCPYAKKQGVAEQVKDKIALAKLRQRLMEIHQQEKV